MTDNPPQTDLRAEAFFAADHAVVENGKLYVNGGGWNRIGVPAFPAVQNLALVVILNVPWRAHHQNHKFAIWFEDADGQATTARLDGQFQVGTSADMRAGDSTIMPLAATVNGLVLQRPGEYAAVLEVDGTEISRWRFKAAQVIGMVMPQQPGEGGPAAIAGARSE